DSTETLPNAIHSPAFKYGVITGVDSKYSADGSVQNLSDIYTVHFDSQQLTKLDPRVTQLVNALNAFSKQDIGQQVDLGTLRIETEPTVRYLVPVYAQGITDKFTLAGALPIIHYQNKLRLAQSPSNVKTICDQLSSKVGDVKAACDQLDFRVTDAVQNRLKAEGYKTIQDRDETLLGDAQVVGLYRFYEDDTRSALFKGTLNLPTGKKNDPDDLTDLGSFGLTSFEPQVIVNWLPFRKLRLAAKAAYKMVFADSLDVRVPTSSDDVLPGPETKEKLRRNIGDTITVGTAATYNIYDSLSIAGGYEYSRKGADSFSGDRGLRYDLLSQDTKGAAHRLRAGISYDTIGLYKRTKAFPPLVFSFEVSNTFAGVNNDRQLVNELTLTMFF
ncbi:MAG: hypothetical protein ACXVBE_03605, partial [Bdellovibrionota bacterium]